MADIAVDGCRAIITSMSCIDGIAATDRQLLAYAVENIINMNADHVSSMC